MRPRSFRSRVTVIGVVTLAIVLGLGSWVTVRALAAGARSDIHAQNTEVIDVVVDQIASGTAPQQVVLPMAQDGTEFIIVNSDEQPVNLSISIIGEGMVLTDSELAELLASGLPPDEVGLPATMAAEYATPDFYPGSAGPAFDEFPDFALPVSLISPESFLRTSRDVATASGDSFTVIAATPLETVTRGIGRLVLGLSIVVPLLVVLGGLALWFALGAALEPVQRISLEASRIAPSNSGRRLPVPDSGDEIASMTKTLNTMLDRLDSGLIRQQQFVSDASHELRSPLTSVKASAELAALDPALAPETAASIDIVRRGTARLEAVLDDLTQLATGADRPLSTTDLDVLILDAVETFDPPCTVRIDTVDVQPVIADVHPVRLSRAIGNVLENAARHATSVVRVTTHVVDGEVSIMIDDDGPGIARVDRERVFERFVRLDEARHRSDGGSGLGLALVSAILVEHGGSATCTASPSGGARFRLQLPRSH